MTRNVCYATLMRELFHTPPMDNFKYLQVFESGDAADRDVCAALRFPRRP